MKEQYEDRTRMLLPRRTYTVIRLDGKAFHTFTKNFTRPFDNELMFAMDQTAIVLCQEIQGAKLAYVQSDEISIILTDFETPQTEAWFDGNIQKIVSVSASICTEAFNKHLPGAKFDSRVFTIPDVTEVENYLIWRQQDATRNSIQMAAQSMFSHKELQGLDVSELMDKMHGNGQNWNDYPPGFKRGRCIIKEKNELGRSRWVCVDPPIFTQDREFIRKHIPKIGEDY